jgi:hypothetical protein
MATNSIPERDSNYMYQMWGTDKLVTDYTVLPVNEKKVIQEIMHDEIPSKKHNLTEQFNLHQKIRNDEDYDDWEYGAEPIYGSSAK